MRRETQPVSSPAGAAAQRSRGPRSPPSAPQGWGGPRSPPRALPFPAGLRRGCAGLPPAARSGGRGRREASPAGTATTGGPGRAGSAATAQQPHRQTRTPLPAPPRPSRTHTHRPLLPPPLQARDAAPSEQARPRRSAFEYYQRPKSPLPIGQGGLEGGEGSER